MFKHTDEVRDVSDQPDGEKDQRYAFCTPRFVVKNELRDLEIYSHISLYSVILLLFINLT